MLYNSTGKLLFLSFFSFFMSTSHAYIPTLILAPEGDFASSGRNHTVAATTECLRFAKELKQILTKNGTLNVIIAAKNKSKTTSYQTVSLANRLKADLFLSLSMTAQDEVKPSVSLYYRSLNPLTELTTQRQRQPSLIPITEAHTHCMLGTKKKASQLYELLNVENNRKFIQTNKPLGLPLKQLTGLIVPGVFAEIGLGSHAAWKPLVKPFAESLIQLLQPSNHVHILQELSEEKTSDA